MRIVFLAVDDKYAGAMQKPLYDAAPDRIVGSVLSSCHIYKKSTVSASWFLLRQSGLRYVTEMLRLKVLGRMVSGDSAPTPSSLAQMHGVETFRSTNINDHESIELLRTWNPDLIVSTNFNHYVGKRVRTLPPLGTWNLHKSYLPHYRGMAPSFYALLDGASHAGATLHRMDAGFDTGDIVAQSDVPIKENDTVFSLNMRTSEEGGRLLAELLSDGQPDRVELTPQPPGDWASHTYPSPGQVRAFLAKGLRFK